MPAAAPTDLAAFFADAAPRLGLSRPAGLCFAAIWRAPEAPDVEALIATTGLSRSGISTALKELREAGLIEVARIPGTRRESFLAPVDAWALLRLHLAQRLRRDIAPMRERLRAVRAAGGDAAIADLADLLEMAAHWLGRLSDAAPDVLAAELGAMKPGGRGKKKKKKG